MQASFQRVFLLLTLIGSSFTVLAQPTTVPRSDSVRRTSQGPRPYREVVTSKAISDGGMFWVHKVEDRYFFEIPDSLFTRDILTVNRISKAAAGMRASGFGYGGDEIGRNVIRFEKVLERRGNGTRKVART